MSVRMAMRSPAGANLPIRRPERRFFATGKAVPLGAAFLFLASHSSFPARDSRKRVSSIAAQSGILRSRGRAPAWQPHDYR